MDPGEPSGSYEGSDVATRIGQQRRPVGALLTAADDSDLHLAELAWIVVLARKGNESTRKPGEFRGTPRELG